MMRNVNRVVSAVVAIALIAIAGFTAPAQALPADDQKLADAAEALHQFTLDEETGIPIALLERAQGIAVIPNMIRGGVIIGGRRGRGVLTVRSPDGGWSNPAFITLTGGSIGGQFG